MGYCESLLLSKWSTSGCWTTMYPWIQWGVSKISRCSIDVNKDVYAMRINKCQYNGFTYDISDPLIHIPLWIGTHLKFTLIGVHPTIGLITPKNHSIWATTFLTLIEVFFLMLRIYSWLWNRWLRFINFGPFTPALQSGAYSTLLKVVFKWILMESFTIEVLFLVLV